MVLFSGLSPIDILNITQKLQVNCVRMWERTNKNNRVVKLKTSPGS